MFLILLFSVRAASSDAMDDVIEALITEQVRIAREGERERERERGRGMEREMGRERERERGREMER